MISPGFQTVRHCKNNQNCCFLKEKRIEHSEIAMHHQNFVTWGNISLAIHLEAFALHLETLLRLRLTVEMKRLTGTPIFPWQQKLGLRYFAYLFPIPLPLTCLKKG